MALIIGMNSGSSFDGIDAVLVELSLGADGHPARPKFLHGISLDWPDDVRSQVLKAFQNEISIFELTRLNYVVGAVYAETARTLMRAANVTSEDVELIGVDTQTIYQEPPNHAGIEALDEGSGLVARWLDGPYPVGLQIGESAVIAAHTDITTITHFRPADHALGGTGAPLMQYLDFVAFRDIAPIMTLNIGGITNCQVVNADRRRMMAFDTGPGNVMMDYAAQKMFNKTHDSNGDIAASGKVVEEMLEELMGHDFFSRKPPRSAWRLDFGADYAAQMMKKYRTCADEDIMATLSCFTANSIVHSIEAHVDGLSDYTQIIVSGGGVRNQTLLRRIGAVLPPHIRLTVSDEFGIPAQFKEAVKFATLAYANAFGLANNIPACSGATGYAILGKTAYAPRHARVNES